jgi:hypothetical protein
VCAAPRCPRGATARADVRLGPDVEEATGPLPARRSHHSLCELKESGPQRWRAPARRWVLPRPRTCSHDGRDPEGHPSRRTRSSSRQTPDPVFSAS